jgi:hypothetical protein
MIGFRSAEGAIRIGADGAEWLAWRLKDETLVSGRMTSSYSVEAALDQWLGRAARFGLKPKRVWLIAGAASCAHRHLRIPGRDLSVVNQAIPFAVSEELPLPTDQMWWTTRATQAKGKPHTDVDLVATPRSLFDPWEDALLERKLDVAGRIPEGPLLWQELAAIRGSEIDMLTVWSERRATIIRGTEEGMSSLIAFVRGPGESWEALCPDLTRPLNAVTEGKVVLSIFTSDRLRRRILSIPDLIPSNSENRLTLEVFHGVPEEVSVAASLLALRRVRIEKRAPEILFVDHETARSRKDLREAAKSVQVSWEMTASAVLVVLLLAMFWYSSTVNKTRAEALEPSVQMMALESSILGNRIKALEDLVDNRVDWGSVWLELSQKIPGTIQFKEFSYGQGSGFRIGGVANDLPNLDHLDTILKGVEYFDNIRIQKTETADKKISFQIFADFTKSSDVDPYLVEDPHRILPGVGEKGGPEPGANQTPPNGAKGKKGGKKQAQDAPKPPNAQASPAETSEGGGKA